MLDKFPFLLRRAERYDVTRDSITPENLIQSFYLSFTWGS
jgi:hypothetical protein